GTNTALTVGRISGLPDEAVTEVEKFAGTGAVSFRNIQNARVGEQDSPIAGKDGPVRLDAAQSPRLARRQRDQPNRLGNIGERSQQGQEGGALRREAYDLCVGELGANDRGRAAGDGDLSHVEAADSAFVEVDT